MGKCHFCGSKKIRLPRIGIGFGMSGCEYDFCYQCLKNMTADQFWRKLFKEDGLKYPPKLKSDIDEKQY